MSHDKTSAPGDKSEPVSATVDAIGGVAAKAAAAAAHGTGAFLENGMSAILYERQAADLALKRARRDDVRAFAQTMRDDFATMESELRSFAGGSEASKDVPEHLIKLHQILLDDLHGADDEHFDTRYVAQQKLAHSEAKTLFKSYHKHGDNGALTNLCRLGLEVIEEHIRALKNLDDTD